MDSPCPSLRANIAQLPRRTSLQDSVVYYVVAGKAARTSEGSGCRKCVPSTCKHRGSTQPQVGGRADCRGGQGSEAGKWSTSRAEQGAGGRAAPADGWYVPPPVGIAPGAARAERIRRCLPNRAIWVPSKSEGTQLLCDPIPPPSYVYISG